MLEKKTLTCFGTGLIVLDLVTNDHENNAPQAWAGGSCGNVLTILAYLGWNSYSVARLGDDLAAKAIMKDMLEHGVNFKYVSFDRSIHTPIILQRIMIGNDGYPTHRFYWTCPNCGNWLPRYTPIRLQDIKAICKRHLRMACFYFDRISPASLQLAQKAKEEGAFVVFEPTAIKDDKQFMKAVALCDILKYSNERTKNYPRLAYESQAKLVVETLGSEGLRYRLRNNGRCGEWKYLPAFRVLNLKDTAGAGDWCTAGIIDVLASSQISFSHLSERIVIDALRYGQALGALNCGFEGARGVMYSIEKSCFNKEVQLILDRKEACTSVVDSLAFGTKKKAQCICPACQETKNKT